MSFPEKNHPAPPTAAIIRIDSNRLIEAVNSRAEEIIGITAAELVGKPAGKVLCANKKFSDLLTLCELACHGEIIRNHPVRLCDSRGKNPRSMLATILPLPGSRTSVAGAVICLNDPSELPYLQQVIMDSIADGVFTVDQHWKITSFNRAAETITGWKADEAVGRSCSEVFHSSICGKTCAIAESLYSGRPVSNRSITIRNQAGETIPISISASPLADHEGNIIGGVETFRDLTALTSLRKQLNRKYHFDEIISKNEAMQKLFAVLPDISTSPSTVLLYGESGTGKELIARAIHAISDRKDQPFIALNCGALPESLLESELFGYKAGAFTDARKDKQGRFAAAEGGTLFLDEIGDMPISVQVKLLRVVQEKIYEPLGSCTPVETNVRIITATNRDLKGMVIDGTFREDLYYRLNVVRIHLPPLRQRKEDLPLLINQFIEEFRAQQGKDIVGISTPAINILMRHDFPGNIRELKNIIEYAFILCDGGYILPEHLPQPFDNGSSMEILAAEELAEPRTLEEIERHAVFTALENNQWKKAQAADELGISNDTLRRKMNKYGLDRPNPNRGRAFT
jgi:PAS domain S-box-containing protein